MALYLVRHAEDRAASGGRFADEGLTGTGESQARALALELGSVEFVGCWSSPLRRARETTQLLLEGRDVPVRVDARLAEGALGELEGLSKVDAAERHPEFFRLGSSVMARVAASGWTAPGGESREAFAARTTAAAQDLAEESRRSGGHRLVVAHGGSLHHLVHAWLGLPASDRVPFGFDHCGWVRLVDYREEPGFGPFPMLRFGSG